MSPSSNTAGGRQTEPHCKEIIRLDDDDAALIAALRDPPPVALLPSLSGLRASICYLMRSRGREGSSYLPLRVIDAACAVNTLFAGHLESDDKDRNAVIFADLHEYRLDRCAVSGSAFGFDFDNSIFDVEREVLEPLRAAGLTAAVYHTYSHNKTTTVIDGDKYLSWTRGKDGAIPPTSESAARYLYDRGKVLHSVVCDVSTASAREKHLIKRGDTLDLRVEHDPIVSVRVVVFPRESVPISGDNGIGTDGWKEIYKALACHIWGDDALSLVDGACANVSRLHYLPTKPPGSEAHQIWHLDGTPVDWKPIWDRCRAEIEERRKRIAERREMDLPASAGELETVLNSIPANCDYATWFRVIAAVHHETQGDGDGFALTHAWSESAPALYDEAALDALWNWLDSSDYGGTPATIGTLIHLARENDPCFSLGILPYREKQDQLAKELMQMINGVQ